MATVRRGNPRSRRTPGSVEWATVRGIVTLMYQVSEFELLNRWIGESEVPKIDEELLLVASCFRFIPSLLRDSQTTDDFTSLFYLPDTRTFAFRLVSFCFVLFCSAISDAAAHVTLLRTKVWKVLHNCWKLLKCCTVEPNVFWAWK